MTQAEAEPPDLDTEELDLSAAAQAASGVLASAAATAAAVRAVVTSATPSAALQASFLAGQDGVKQGLVELIQGWVDGSRAPVTVGQPEEVAWFLSKRGTALINEWLMNSRLSALAPVSPTGTGMVVIARDRVEHVNDGRTHKDGVSQAGVVELLSQLFVHGTPKFAPNPGYPTQLAMFDASYKAQDPAARGETPFAAVQFHGAPVAHLRLETAYWMKPGKAKALETRALAKRGK